MNKRYCAVNNWLIDVSSGSILHLTNGERKRLGEFQLKLLDTLTQHAGKILTREELTTLVWEHRVIGNNSLPNAIHALRTALEDDGKQQRIIKTIPRKGYLLEADYCSVIEKEENEVFDKSDETQLSEAIFFEDTPPLDMNEEAVPPFLSEQTSGAADALKHAPTMTRVFPWQRFPAVVLLITAALIIAVFATWRYFEHSHHRLQYEERETNVYSNIRLFEIFPQGHQGSYQDQFYNKLKGTLYQMN